MSLVYIADLDQDIDDIIAIECLVSFGILDAVICSPWPIEDVGIKRLNRLSDLSISVIDELPDKSDVFAGGSLTPVAKAVKDGKKIGNLVANGGFVGYGISEDELSKFKGKTHVRTYNFNCDVEAADAVLRSDKEQIGRVILVGKNVCHSPYNTLSGIWGNDPVVSFIAEKYDVDKDKRLHDILACHEGLSLCGFCDCETFCNFAYVKPHAENNTLSGNLTKWGSILPEANDSLYRTVEAAIGWRKVPR